MSKARASKLPETETKIAIRDSSSLIITFTIPNFSLLKNRTDAIDSSRVDIRRSSWYIWVMPKEGGKKEIPNVEINVRHEFLKTGEKCKGPIADILIVIPNSKFPSQQDILDPDYAYGGICMRLGHNTLFGPNATSPLEKDKLMIQAEIRMLYQEAISEELPRYRLCKIFGSEVGRDFTLVSGDGDERHVHKAVLNASSPVFERMFQSNLEECHTGRCVIPDISTATLDILLYFMYYCSVEQLTKNAREIMPAADKYEMLDLKQACEEALKNTISLDTMGDLLLLADMTSAGELKEAVLKIVETEPDPFEDPDTASAITALEDKAIKSGRTDLVREVFSAGYKSGRKQ